MAEGKTTSFANMHGEEWETKEISVYGAAKAFISQISVGMDLTHVSIPAIFLLPYSILEFVCARTTSAFHILLPLGQEKDPRKRLEGLFAQFAVSTLQLTGRALQASFSTSWVVERTLTSC